MNQPTLARRLSLPIIIFYGLGTILGAGIYALVGKVAAKADLFAPWAFLLASFIAFFTAISYAELSAKYPVSAGEAYFVQQGFNQRWLSAMVGWLIIITGLVSAATLAHGFSGYLNVFIPLHDTISILLLLSFLCIIAIWGIMQSAIFATIITIMEIGGIILIVALAGDSLLELPSRIVDFIPSGSSFQGILTGSFIAFYAYVGFEDLENIAEEIKQPERNLPIAILTIFVLATLLYLLASLVAVLALPIEALSESTAPFADILAYKGYSPWLIGVISLVAMINGALVQIIMASRVLYGMANQQTAPKIFSRVHAKTRTPIFATLFIGLCTSIFALSLPIVTLAKATSTVLLFIFVLVNSSLVIIKMREKQSKTISFSIFFPITGTIVSILFLCAQFIPF